MAGKRQVNGHNLKEASNRRFHQMNEFHRKFILFPKEIVSIQRIENS